MTIRSLVGTFAVLLVLGALVVYFFGPIGAAPGGIACTMETKLCPDGSYVGRTGPNCEFAACPTSTTDTPPVVGEGEHCGGFIQNAPVCASGFHCELKISMPDTGGVCVADSTGGGGGIPPYDSGIRGTVMLGPTCPVMRNPPDPQCADRPYATEVSVARAVDPAHPISVLRSDSQGAFEVSLPPAEYVVSVAGGNMLPRCSPVSVTVSPNAYATASVTCDTGIR